MPEMKGVKPLLLRFGKAFGFALILVWLSGCSTVGTPEPADVPVVQDAFSPAAAARYAKGLELMEAGDDEAAANEFVGLTEDYAGYAGPMVNLAIIHRRNNRTQAAYAMLTRAISVCTDCAVAYNELGILQRQQGRFDDAEQSYLKSIESDPGYALAYLNLGVLYDLYQRRLTLALENYERYVELSDDSNSVAEVEKWIADVRRRVGQPAQTGDSP
jgi:tetratricopeptide (TPR) repeat protein